MTLSVQFTRHKESVISRGQHCFPLMQYSSSSRTRPSGCRRVQACNVGISGRQHLKILLHCMSRLIKCRPKLGHIILHVRDTTGLWVSYWTLQCIHFKRLWAGSEFWWSENIVKMINKRLKYSKNDLKWLKISKNDIKTTYFFVFNWRHGSTTHIYFHQRNKSYLIQHCCSRQPPTCADYRKLGNACCWHVPFPHHLTGTKVFLVACRFHFNCRHYPIILHFIILP